MYITWTAYTSARTPPTRWCKFQLNHKAWLHRRVQELSWAYLSPDETSWSIILGYFARLWLHNKIKCWFWQIKLLVETGVIRKLRSAGFFFITVLKHFLNLLHLQPWNLHPLRKFTHSFCQQEARRAPTWSQRPTQSSLMLTYHESTQTLHLLVWLWLCGRKQEELEKTHPGTERMPFLLHRFLWQMIFTNKQKAKVIESRKSLFCWKQNVRVLLSKGQCVCLSCMSVT